MTRDEFRQLSEPWNGKLPILAELLGKSHDVIKQYRAGGLAIPEKIAEKIKKLPPPVLPQKKEEPPRMSAAEFARLSQKWSSRQIAKLLSIPKGTIDAYKYGVCKKVSRLAQERIYILLARDAAGESLENLFPSGKKADLTLKTGIPYIPARLIKEREYQAEYRKKQKEKRAEILIIEKVEWEQDELPGI